MPAMFARIILRNGKTFKQKKLLQVTVVMLIEWYIDYTTNKALRVLGLIKHVLYE